MLKFGRVIFFLTFIIAATAAIAAPKSEEKKGLTIKPSDVLEKCLKLQPTQTLNYSFEASKPVKFNLHYHLEDKTVFPVKEQTSRLEGTFHPVKDQKVYCMEWKNVGTDTITLDYTYEVKDR